MKYIINDSFTNNIQKRITFFNWHCHWFNHMTNQVYKILGGEPGKPVFKKISEKLWYRLVNRTTNFEI